MQNIDYMYTNNAIIIERILRASKRLTALYLDADDFRFLDASCNPKT